jgi:UDP-glucose-4-epimerase GalE
MKICVAGGAGYIGSHTVKELLNDGFEVLVLDDFSTGKRELLVGGDIREIDLRDAEAVRGVFQDEKIGAVLHFASLIQVGESYENPHKYYTHNCLTSLNLLGAMASAGVRRFIFSSSAAVYGNPEHIPIREDHPMKPANPYGMTKKMVEDVLPDYRRAYGIESITLRYFNAAGADPGGRLGEMHEPETHLIPNILLPLLGRKKALCVFGTDFNTDDGTAVRDYIHVTDLARAHILALKKLLHEPISEALNLGAGKGFSVLEVICMAEKVTGKKITYTTMPRRKGDVPVLLASKEKAAAVLGWELEHSSLDTIIETAWDWHKKQP